MQVIALVSGKGGVGKTTVTANLAIALGQHRKRVLVIDLDPQNAASIHLGLDPNEIAGLAREGISAESVFESPFGVKFIPFGNVNDEELAEFESVLRADPEFIHKGLLALDPKRIDYVLIDTPPGATIFLKQAMHAAQQAIAVVLADAASFTTIPKLLSLAAGHTAGRADFSGVNLLVNQMTEKSVLGHQVRAALYENYAQIMIPVAIHKDASVAEALAYERPVLQYNPDGKASLDINDLVEWLLIQCEA
jgi:cellulose synthase operon protein YhjQ